MWKPLSLKKTSTIVTTRARKRWGRKRDGESPGHRLHCWIEHALRDRAKDSIHRPRVWWMGNISDVLALDPCLTPVCRALLHTGFPPSNACFPIRRLSLAKPEESSRTNHATRH